MLVTGRTVFFTDNWKGIQASQQVNSLLAKDAIEEVPMSELCYSSNIFLVAKKSRDKRPVLNLRPLNNFVPNETFKMEGIHSFTKRFS